MLRMRVGAEDLTGLRFAISPLIETIYSVNALDDPASRTLHLPWIVEARSATADLDLSLIRALQPRDVYTPDFVQPPPAGPLADFEEELARVAATPAAEIRREIRRAYGDRVPAVLQPLLDQPRRAVRELVELIRAYWERALAPHWPRLRSVLEGDVLHRARSVADGGAGRLFADIDPTVRYADGILEIDKPFDATIDLAGRGLLFIPSAFTWPRVRVLTEPPWQPTLLYPARGIGTLWDQAGPAIPEALAALLGRRRAGILTALDAPRSTTDLARKLDAPASGISQHLAVLRDAGLVSAHRVGRVVLYLRSPLGEALIGSRRFSLT
jgi:DNA-binding transcriptional ArsR family regulator